LKGIIFNKLRLLRTVFYLINLRKLRTDLLRASKGIIKHTVLRLYCFGALTRTQNVASTKLHDRFL
jgi:hypothetical protein